ncbi:MAG TPA: universal stress protein [Pirellulales bacterium]|nr:universal stress protein [Pirellulales bacterium]
MNMPLGTFRKILVATDFSPAAETALEQAVALARGCDAQVTVVHVIKNVHTTLQLMAYAPAWGPASEELAERERALRWQAREKLQALIAPDEAAGVRIRQEVLVGAPFIEIIHAVQLGAYDLVVTGTRGQPALKRALVGSTATKLARKCPCPVWIARLRENSTSRCVLAPVDFSDVSHRTAALAASLAASSGATLHLLHVYDMADLEGVPVPPEDNKAEFLRNRRQMRLAALDQLRQLSESLSPKPDKTTLNVAPGIPWQVIRAATRRAGADLIVMGSVGRGGIPGLLIGNTAEKVLHTTDVSLLIVKPNGFASPVPPLEKIISKQPERQPTARQSNSAIQWPRSYSASRRTIDMSHATSNGFWQAI